MRKNANRMTSFPWSILICVWSAGAIAACGVGTGGTKPPLFQSVPDAVPEKNGDEIIGAEFRGYVAINRLIRERFLQDGASFELSSYLGEEYVDPSLGVFTGTNLIDLLGGYQGSGHNSRFNNGEPNSLNMLLWYLILKEFSKKIGSVCIQSDALPLNAAFVQAAQALCSWPPGKESQKLLSRYWIVAMGFEAPLEEMVPWVELALSEDARVWRNDEALEKLTFAILFNPYFLLRH
jgi:hypothetical protein